MKRIFAVIMLAASASAWAQTTPRNTTIPRERWLTQERAAQLRRITSRPYITQRVSIGGGMAEYHWANGYREWVTTQAVSSIQGAKAAHGWQKKVDAEAAARKELIEDVKALAAKGNASKKDLEAVVDKAKKEKGDVKWTNSEKAR